MIVKSYMVSSILEFLKTEKIYCSCDYIGVYFSLRFGVLDSYHSINHNNKTIKIRNDKK